MKLTYTTITLLPINGINMTRQHSSLQHSCIGIFSTAAVTSKFTKLKSSWLLYYGEYCRIKLHKMHIADLSLTKTQWACWTASLSLQQPLSVVLLSCITASTGLSEHSFSLQHCLNSDFYCWLLTSQTAIVCFLAIFLIWYCVVLQWAFYSAR